MPLPVVIIPAVKRGTIFSNSAMVKAAELFEVLPLNLIRKLCRHDNLAFRITLDTKSEVYYMLL